MIKLFFLVFLKDVGKFKLFKWIKLIIGKYYDFLGLFDDVNFLKLCFIVI